MAELSEASAPLRGEIEIDESYFGARRVRGKRGRGAGRKVPVIGVLKRQGNVYCDVLDDGSKLALEAVIKGRVNPESVIPHRRMERLRWPARYRLQTPFTHPPQ